MPHYNRSLTRHEENVTIDSIYLSKDGNAFDLSNVFHTLIIDEDIESGFCRGKLLFPDSFLKEEWIFQGTEYIDVTFNSLDINFKELETPYSKRFRVTNYSSNKDSNTDKVNAIVLEFVTDAAIINESIKLKRSYKESSSGFVSKCLDLLNYPYDYHIEETLHVKHFVAPNVSPLNMINWVKLNSQSKETNGSDFYFFENKDGINFKSIESLKSNPATQTICFRPNIDMFTYNTILKFEKPKGYNLRDDIRYGGAGASLYTHDLVHKDYKKFTYSYENIPKLNPANPRGEGYEFNNNSYVQFWPHDNSYQSLDVNSNTHNALLRSMSRTLMNFKTINVEIPGNIDIKSGDIINVLIYGKTGMIQPDESGKWMVKKLRHILTMKSFHTQLELTSDGNIEHVQ